MHPIVDRHIACATGYALRTARLDQGLGQRELARRAGITHKAVGYWEAKPELDLHAYAVKRIVAALGLARGEFLSRHARARHGVLHPDAMLDLLTAFAPSMSRRLCRRIAYGRVTCGAITRKGTPCRAKSEPGRRRCKFHGGYSTGPKTPEGRARIAEAQRKRWDRRRREVADRLLPAAILVFLFFAVAADAAQTVQGRVTTVRDVDTVEVRGVPVRLNGLDGPETSTRAGRDARNFMVRLLRGKSVTCHLTGARTYDRWVGTCYLDGIDIAAIAVANGHALDCARFSGGRYRQYETPAARARLTRARYC